MKSHVKIINQAETHAAEHLQLSDLSDGASESIEDDISSIKKSIQLSSQKKIELRRESHSFINDQTPNSNTRLSKYGSGNLVSLFSQSYDIPKPYYASFNTPTVQRENTQIEDELDEDID